MTYDHRTSEIDLVRNAISHGGRSVKSISRIAGLSLEITKTNLSRLLCRNQIESDGRHPASYTLKDSRCLLADLWK